MTSNEQHAEALTRIAVVSPVGGGNNDVVTSLSPMSDCADFWTGRSAATTLVYGPFRQRERDPDWRVNALAHALPAPYVGSTYFPDYIAAWGLAKKLHATRQVERAVVQKRTLPQFSRSFGTPKKRKSVARERRRLVRRLEELDASAKDPSGRAYVIRAGDGDYYKIGCSRVSAESRVVTGQTFHERLLRVVWRGPRVPDMFAAERALHDRFVANRSQLGGGSEWFHFPDGLPPAFAGRDHGRPGTVAA